jgi:hypothetical protein
LGETLEQISNLGLHKLLVVLCYLIFCYHPSSFSVVYLLIDRSKIHFSQYNTLLEIFCVYTEISEDNIGVLAAYQQAFACCFCRAASYLDSTSCIQHLGGFPSSLLDLGDISPLFSSISHKFLKFFLVI